jgi:hypothetical protein
LHEPPMAGANGSRVVQQHPVELAARRPDRQGFPIVLLGLGSRAGYGAAVGREAGVDVHDRRVLGTAGLAPRLAAVGASSEGAP